MSNIITGRARVVYVGDEFVHLSKGGLDGKIVAYKDSWLASSYDLQDWVTFRAKQYEAGPPHCNFGVRFKALPKSVKFESKAVICEGVGTFFKVDEHQGQYGFIATHDMNTVYFTASVVRPETQDIRSTFKTGVQLRYKAIEQKQNNCRWRAIVVCSKNATLDSFSSRLQRPTTESSLNKQIPAPATKKTSQSSVGNSTNKFSTGNDDVHHIAQQRVPRTFAEVAAILAKPHHEQRTAANNLPQTVGSSIQQLNKQINPTAAAAADSRASSVSRSEISGTSGSANRIPSTASSAFPLLTTNALNPQNPFADGSTGDAYEDAVRRLAYFRHLVTNCSCESCLLR